MEANELIEKYQNNKTLRDFFIRSDRIWDKREGYFEGIDERNIEIVKNMIQEGLDINTISRVTNINLEEMENFKLKLISKNYLSVFKYYKNTQKMKLPPEDSFLKE